MKNSISVNGSILGLASTLLLASISTNISAAGFAIAEQSVKGLGSAFSGGAASAEDASTVWYNPAGMTRFSGTHVSSALHLILPNTEYSDSGSIINPALTSGATVPLGGSNGVREKDAILPNFYVVHKVDDQMSVGLGVNAPFGLVTDHDADWVGRYHALQSDLVIININPSVAFKATSNFSIGVGWNIQYVDVKLSRAIDTSAACLSAASRGAVSAATCGALGLTTPGNPATDSQVRLEADDWSYGYNIGFLYEPSSNTRLGLHYRSSIKHRTEGRAEFFYTNPAAGMFGTGAGLVNQGITAGVDLPESVSLSGFHQINSQWSIQGDVTWVKWDRFKELRIRFDTGAPTDSVTPEQWENTIRYAVGASFAANDKLTLRGGVAYDETPIPDASLRTARVADEDRIWLAVGATYALSDHLSFDVGYTHLFVDDPEIDYVSNFPNTPHAGDSSLQRGEYDASVNILSAQVNVAF